MALSSKLGRQESESEARLMKKARLLMEPGLMGY